MTKIGMDEILQPITPIPTDQQARGSLSRPVDGMLFDLYGTLFISNSGDISTVRRGKSSRIEKLDKLIDAYGLRFSPDEVVERLYKRIEIQHQIDKAAGIAFPEVRIDRIWRDLLGNDLPEARLLGFAASFEMIMNPVWPMPNAEDLIKACKQAGMVMGIISNAQFYTPGLFRHFFHGDTVALGFHPRLTFYSYLLGEAKPSPTPFKMAKKRIEAMNIDPGRIVYIGNDMRNDIAPAHNAGFRTVLFAGDRRSLRLREKDPACRDLTPDMIITDLNQLQPYVKTAAS